MVESADGARQTFVTEDVEYVRVMAAGAKTPGLLGGLQIPPGKFPLIRDGWVDEWTA
ncbi:hypothetical protein [Streptomyces noursei]|nr:hypothetical protein [Streptomyces noursei]UWS77559.1 hypothetical protein N1H47_40845 [Streptomyces noursei]